MGDFNAAIASILATSFVGGLVAFFWKAFSVSSKNACDALNLSQELERRVNTIDKEVIELRVLNSKVAGIEANVENIKTSQKRIENILISMQSHDSSH